MKRFPAITNIWNNGRIIGLFILYAVHVLLKENMWVSCITLSFLGNSVAMNNFWWHFLCSPCRRKRKHFLPERPVSLRSWSWKEKGLLLCIKWVILDSVRLSNRTILWISRYLLIWTTQCSEELCRCMLLSVWVECHGIRALNSSK
jgi:hypothetical protein